MADGSVSCECTRGSISGDEQRLAIYVALTNQKYEIVNRYRGVGGIYKFSGPLS